MKWQSLDKRSAEISKEINKKYKIKVKYLNYLKIITRRFAKGCEEIYIVIVHVACII